MMLMADPHQGSRDHAPSNLPEAQGHPWVAVDVVLFSVNGDTIETLLVRVKGGPFAGRWAFPGGLVGLDESLDEAARRELEEKTPVRAAYLEQLFTFGGVQRNPTARVVSTAYFALLPTARPATRAGQKYADAAWFPVAHLPHLAYDHDEITRVALDRLRSKITYTNVAYSLLPEQFTMAELQRIYEIILGTTLDRRNFRKKILASGLLRPSGTKRRGPHRPASLYTFVERLPRMIELF